MVHPIYIGLIAFACTFGGALLGMRLRPRLPEHHLSDASRDTVKVGIGLVATMTALVLGLVTASAKSSFDALNTAIKHAGADILALDRVLSRYGPETHEIREVLKQAVARRIELTWPKAGSRPAPLDVSDQAAGVEKLQDRVRALSPQTDAQRWLQTRALDLGEGLLKTRWLIFGGMGSAVPVPFLVVLLFWLTITFTSFGLFAPANATVLAVLLVCALSVSGAILLVLEMDDPFEGLITVSAEPLRYAHSRLNH
jgi:hypothetical protein